MNPHNHSWPVGSCDRCGMTIKERLEELKAENEGLRKLLAKRNQERVQAADDLTQVKRERDRLNAVLARVQTKLPNGQSATLLDLYGPGNGYSPF